MIKIKGKTNVYHYCKCKTKRKKNISYPEQKENIKYLLLFLFVSKIDKTTRGKCIYSKRQSLINVESNRQCKKQNNRQNIAKIPKRK